MDGNPSCGDLGFAYGYKFDGGPFNGTGDDGYINATISSSDGIYVDWSSLAGVDLVIVKGGSNANLYYYDPESMGDTHLSSPINPNNGTPYGLSHVDFCFDYEVQVAKTAATSFERTYDWNITKVVDQGSLTLSPGQSHLVNYAVGVSMVGSADSDFAVAGTITVSNPAPVAATITGVSDILEGDALTVSCPVSFPYDLAPGQSLVCSYQSGLPDGSSRTNVAEVSTSGVVGGNSTSVPVSFASATITHTDDCVAVSDSMAGALGTVCVGDAPKTWSYPWTIGPFASPAQCGTNIVPNIASFQSDDGGDSGSAGASVTVEVPCTFGCSLTQGYWKTHSIVGPAPYDDTWALKGESTQFFQSGYTWHSVLLAPVKGDPWLILARQYVAAVMNGLNGADLSAIAADLAAATALLDLYDSNPYGSGSMGKAAKAQAITLAGKLDAYNNGAIGPGHCSE
jgi:hypothetical protein